MTSRSSRALPPIPPATPPPVLGESHPLYANPEPLVSSSRRRPNSDVSTSESFPPDETRPYSRSSRYSGSVPELLEVPPSRSPSPTVIAASEYTALSVSPSPAAPCGTAKKKEILVLMVKRTSAWVLGGMGLMIAGIGLAQGVILPRIFTCPAGADCPMSFDPNKTSVLTYLQSLMQYLLMGGMLIASIGMLRLSAYQA